MTFFSTYEKGITKLEIVSLLLILVTLMLFKGTLSLLVNRTVFYNYFPFLIISFVILISTFKLKGQNKLRYAMFSIILILLIIGSLLLYKTLTLQILNGNLKSVYEIPLYSYLW